MAGVNGDLTRRTAFAPAERLEQEGCSSIPPQAVLPE